MKKTKLLPFLCLIFSSTLSFSQTDALELKTFGIDELKEDFSYWRNRLEQKHPLIYLYTSKEQIDRCFDSLYQQINHPMTELDFIKLLTPVMALIQDGHNYVLPSEPTLAKIRNYKYLFPLELKFINEKLYVTKDLSTSEVPLTGLEITSINTISSKDMLHLFLSNLGRDGHNDQYAYASINKSFRLYFHTNYGFSKTYLISYRTKDNRDNSCTIEARSLVSMQQEKLNKYPLEENSSKSGLTFNIIDSIQTAVLSIKTFSPNTSNRKFRKEISNYFETLKKTNTSNLIIDLRDNSGGNPNHVKFILQHLFDKPFEQALACRIVKNSQEDKFLERTRKKWYPWYGIGTFKPQKNNFKGSLCVLVNEGTFSAGVIFSSVLRKYQRAVFVGNETGGNPIIMAGYLLKTSWKLPHTSIQIGAGTLCTIYDDLSLNQGRGLVPDFIVPSSSEDIFSLQDKCLQFGIGLVRGVK